MFAYYLFSIGSSFGLQSGESTFRWIFKISTKSFDYIAGLVRDEMKEAIDPKDQPLSPDALVAVAIRRLGSGDSLKSVGELFGIEKSTVSKTTSEFLKAMYAKGIDHHLRWPSTEAEMKEVKSKFEKIQGLPNCCGAIDTTHILRSRPARESEIWCDKRDKYSMVLQAVVDPDLRIRDISTGWPGAMTDSSTLQSSSFYRVCQEGARLNGEKKELSQGNELREYIVGDAGYPLLPWLLTPYKGRKLSKSQVEYNKRHCETRLVAARALMRLKDMWKIIQGTVLRPQDDQFPTLVSVCCVLHNILIDLNDEVLEKMPSGHDHDPGYKQQTCRDVVDQDASVMRDHLALYLSRMHV